MGSSHSVPAADEVKFLWVRFVHSPHRRLSLNVVREICVYLYSFSPLIAVTPSAVLCADVRNQRAKVMFPLKDEVRIGAGSSFVLIHSAEVFVCGGDSVEKAIVADAYLLSEDRVTRLSDMREGRKGAGLYYDFATRCVLVFGGDSGVWGVHNIRSSEKLSLHTESWKRLPDMHESRKYFNPCAKQRLVYLVGGWTTSVETFHIEKNEYNLLQLALKPLYNNQACAAAFFGQKLVVLSLDTLEFSDDNQLEWEESSMHAPSTIWSNCPPLLTSRYIFIVSTLEMVCSGFDLTTGEKQVEISLWI